MTEKKDIKELNKEELEKVSGGGVRKYIICTKCREPYEWATAECNAYMHYYKCPNCGHWNNANQ